MKKIGLLQKNKENAINISNNISNNIDIGSYDYPYNRKCKACKCRH